ncbi:Calx-beta domain-containing protein [Methylobacterium flocculans]|uniref:Calx-beta domain-containing protein n=1 Tax=Methylobacterium flocculans TaxID=2984843 RepID=UPI0021F2A67C|nr:Calx-beta domain-containing protein [Methylobacterium sp. FF17]
MTLLGAYVGNSAKDVLKFESWLDRPVDFVRAHTGRGSWWDYDSSIGWVGSQLQALNKPINWTIPMFAFGGNLAEAASGAYDDHYVKAAQSILKTRSVDEKIFVRFGEEFNGGWMPWAAKGKEGDFIQTYRNMVDAFRSVSDKFVFEWNVNVGHQGMDPAKAYPGDAYVDVIGMDFYLNTAWDPKDPLAAWDYMVKRDYGLQWLESFAAQHGKPTAYAEWGIKADNAAPYITKAAEWFQSHNVLYQSYWDDNNEMPSKISDGSNPQNAAEAAAYKAAFGTAPNSNNVAPVGHADAYTLDENGILRVSAEAGVIGNDTDANSDALLAMLVDGPAHGKLTLNADGSFTYVPDLNYSGADSFTYAPRDPSSAGNLTKVSLTVTESHDAPASAAPVNWIVGTNGSDTLVGDARNNSLNGAAGQDTMKGGVGDDTYVVDQANDVVVEYANEGIDTVESWAPTYTLSAHVENLKLLGTGQTGIGNELANGITGGAGNDILNGKGGNDWLTGGAGADTFVFEIGSGHDVVRDFATSGTQQDVVKLSGYDFASFAQIRAALTQVGADTLLKLSDDSSVTFLNHKVSDFAASHFKLPNPTYTITGQPKVAEGADLVFTVSRSDDNGAQTLSYRLGGTATSGLDYDAPSGSVTFAPGELTKQIVVTTKADALLEGNESVVVTLSGVTGAGTISTASATGTLVDATTTAMPQPRESASPVNWVVGTNGSDTLVGDARNNSLNGAAGQDTMKGGVGDDTYVVDQANDVVVEYANEGIDTVESWAPTYTLSAHVENLKLLGTGQTGIGNELANGITGGAGNDILNGKGGNDWLTGGAGADTFVFEIGSGHDVVRDFATSGTQQDVVKLSGYDFASFAQIRAALTQVGADTLLKLSDDSSVTFLNHKVSDFAASHFKLPNPTYTITGQPKVAEGADLVFTVSRSDDNGAQTLSYRLGGTATSGLDYDAPSGSVTFAPGELTKQIVVTTKADALLEGNESVVVTLSGVTGAGTISTASATGTLVDATTTAMPQPRESASPVNWVVGTNGSDTLVGDARNNSLNGAAGQDTMKGGVGDDTYVVDQANDVVVEYANEGIDTVESWAPTYTLSAHVENLKLLGTGQTGIGNDLANLIIGSKGADILNGKGGNDWLTGGAGADTFVFEIGSGHDVVTDFTTSGTQQDVVKLSGYDFASFAQVQAALTQVGADTVLKLSDEGSVTFLNHKVSDFTATHFGMIEAVGPGITDSSSMAAKPIAVIAVPSPIYTITGSPSAEEGGNLVFTLSRNSDDGVKTLNYKLSGTATSGLDYAAPSGAVTFAAGELTKQLALATKVDDLVEGSESVMVTLSGVTGTGTLGAESTATGSILDPRPTPPSESGKAASWIYGTSGNDTLNGDKFNNYLIGEAGQDTAKGGKGDDTYNVESMNDKVIELANEGIDTVESWGHYTLSANVENLKLLGLNLTGTGNELANRIEGGRGNDTLNGKAGNDWLTGGTGTDTFVFERATGHDVITDFVTTGAGQDLVKLVGFDFASFAQVRAGLIQVGADTLLKLSDDSSVTFLNHKVADFHAGDFML